MVATVLRQSEVRACFSVLNVSLSTNSLFLYNLTTVAELTVLKINRQGFCCSNNNKSLPELMTYFLFMFSSQRLVLINHQLVAVT